MNPSSRVMFRLLASVLLPAAGVGVLDGCCNTLCRPDAGDEPPPAVGEPTRFSPACTRTTDCSKRNQVCVHTGGAPEGECQPPTGSCDPEASLEGQCYPEARCDLAAPTTPGLGSCSFQAPARPVFPVERTLALGSPTVETELFAASGFTFQWQPLRGVPGAVTVVMVSSRPPTFDPVSGRITNRGDVVWAWSTAEPGDAVGGSRAMDGTVPVRFGRRGVARDGTFGAAWGRDTMDAGQYWWFAYAISQGEVVATSVAQGFVVGAAPARPRTCRNSSECIGASDLPEMFECYASQCRRRCASNRDCATEGTTCNFTEAVSEDAGVRRGAFCTTVISAMQGDAGVSDGGVQ